MKHNDLIPHLFRSEFRKIASVLTRYFGIEHIQAAEDIASETFLSALEIWPYKGIPENSVAWLYAVAKNKATNYLNRRQTFSEKVSPQVKRTASDHVHADIDLSEKNITDSQLQMLFAICHPSVSMESQIALALRTLCGFGIEELANAFLTNKETINKRLFRAREKLRMEKVKIEFPADKEINERLDAVLITLYLLYNEGYYSESDDAVLREELCLEAMRLTWLLIENDKTDLTSVNALFSLMCFHASRFPARKNNSGELVLYQDQDETLWNQELITKGAYHLSKASQHNVVSRYHLEAAIAYWHTRKEDTQGKWETILQLYNQLLQIAYSPVAALNRTYALSKANSRKEAITEAEKLALRNNPYYHTLLGELYNGIDQEKARAHFLEALSLAKTETDRAVIRKKITDL